MLTFLVQVHVEYYGEAAIGVCEFHVTDLVQVQDAFCPSALDPRWIGAIRGSNRRNFQAWCRGLLHV